MNNFYEKLNNQFEELIITSPSSSSNIIHLYADYIELITVVSCFSEVTVADIVDRLFDQGKELSDIEYIENGIIDDEIGTNSSEIDDDRFIKVQSYFNEIEHRSFLFKELYPFDVKDNFIRSKKDLSDEQKLYIYLLITSNLNIFKNVSSELTSEFESLSLIALKNYLPNTDFVFELGKNTDIKGSAINKINELATMMNIEVNDREISHINVRNNQERGLDIIGWLPFDDINSNMIIILGQCACGKKWYEKQRETKRYEKYLKFETIKPIHTLFIPYSLINSNYHFHQSDEMSDNHLLFERKRISEMIKDYSFFKETYSYQVVEKCISYEEDIV